MGKSLEEIAEELKGRNKKVLLVYAFNGTGKTRLSRVFKELISPKQDDEESEDNQQKILYYNAFTEDLFYWDNDSDKKLIIRDNSFTPWVLDEQGQTTNITTNFQHYTSDKLTPLINENKNEAMKIKLKI
mgnify:FL=1